MKRLSLVLVLLFAANLFGQISEKVVPIKVVEKDGVIDKLQIAVVSYARGTDTLQVIGTVHIADESYYKMLNERFKKYDALLYELVGPDDRKPDPDEESLMRTIVNLFLNLEHQLAVVDYTAPNFVHADMTPEKIQKAMEKNGDTVLTVALDTISDAMRKYNKQQGQPEEAAPDIQLFGNPNAAVEIKRMMAKQFVGEDISSGLGRTLESYLIGERNSEAIKVLEEQVKKKHNLGLYYGAAHLPDFDTRLRTSGWSRVKVEYDTAWSGLSQRQTNEEAILKILQRLEKYAE